LTTSSYSKFLCLDNEDTFIEEHFLKIFCLDNEDTFIEEHFLQKNFPADYIFHIIEAVYSPDAVWIANESYPVHGYMNARFIYPNLV
jgi:hypothetical protein